MADSIKSPDLLAEMAVLLVDFSVACCGTTKGTKMVPFWQIGISTKLYKMYHFNFGQVPSEIVSRSFYLYFGHLLTSMQPSQEKNGTKSV